MLSLSGLALFLAVLSPMARAQQSYPFFSPSPSPPLLVTATANSPFGQSSYCYWVVVVYPIGKSTPSAPSCLSNAIETSTVLISWSAASGASSYDVLRTTTPVLPNVTSSIAVATAVSGTTQTDSFGALSSYTITSAVPATANLYLDNTAFQSPQLRAVLTGVGGTTAFNLSAGNSGTVTSVGWTGGIVSVASPTTTPAFTVAGTSGGVVGFTGSSTWATSIAGVTGAMMSWGGAGNTPTSPLSLLVTNQNTASETWTWKNTTASTGLTNFVVAGGVANSAGGNPYMFKVVDNANTFKFGVSPLGEFIATSSNSLNFCDENVVYPCNRFLANSNDAIDLVIAVPGSGTPDSSGHGQFNIELGQNITSTSGTGSFVWFGDNSKLLGFAPTSGTGVWNGLWVNWVINQTGGASGITRGVYVNNTITAAADFRGLEVSDVGSSQTAIKTGTGKVTFGDTVTLSGSSASAGQAACIGTGGSVGHCTSVVGAGGGCTCVVP